MKRVVVTGIGVVSPIGSTLDGFWASVVEGRSGIAPISGFLPGELRCTKAAQVRDFTFADHFGDANEAGMDRVSQFAVVAARAAASDAELLLNDELAQRVPVIIGTGAGGMNTLDHAYERLYRKGIPRVHPLTVPSLMISAPASCISIDLQTRGPAFCVSGACASGAQAITSACEMIRSGRSEVAITGGSEACVTLGTLVGWEALRVMSNDTCRPFSRTRSGMVLGEGACVLILEERERARARGARVYAELAGWGQSADAISMTVPDAGGASRSISAALVDAGIDAGRVSYINAHGTGTILNDATEAVAMHKVFGGGRTCSVPVSASKSVLGHSLGAAGAMEAAITALSVHHGTIPPTANFEEKDPECDVNLVVGTAIEHRLDTAISNSFAFGGINCTLAFSNVH